MIQPGGGARSGAVIVGYYCGRCAAAATTVVPSNEDLINVKQFR